MNKPEKKYPVKPMYDYHEVIDYIEEKYNINTRDYGKKFTKDGNMDNEYLDFWHWLVEHDGSISNGSTSMICIDSILNNEGYGEPEPDWIKEICKMIKDEDFTDEEGFFYFWVEW